MQITSSASGKVILAGEYAVLAGAPCLVMAVDRRLSITCTPGHARTLRVSARGLDADPVEWHYADGSFIEGKRSTGQFELLRRLLNHLAAESSFCDELLKGWVLEIDSRPLFEAGNKLGLGSSAALTVALVSALSEMSQSEFGTADKYWLACHRAHSHAQQKQGSGADIAAGLQGGITLFRPQAGEDKLDENKPIAENPSVAKLSPYSLPDDINMAFLWSGTSASTPLMLGNLHTWQRACPGRYQSHQYALRQVMHELLTQTEATAFISMLKKFTEGLNHLDRDADLGIFAAGHELLWQASTQFRNLVYKPCGAGGGDLGIVVANDKEQLARFMDLAKKSKFTPVAMHIDQGGPDVRIQH